MPFGLTNAPATSSRLMDMVLAGLQWQVCLLYLDDITVFSSDFETHLARLELVSNRLRQANLRLKPFKCHFAQREVVYLEHVQSEAGVSPDPTKNQAVRDFPRHKTATDVRAFLAFPDFTKQFQLHTDAGLHFIGAMLSQIQFGRERVIAYASRSLNSAEQNYPTIQRECLVIFWACRTFRPYIYGQSFLLLTDYKPLVYLRKQTNLTSRLTRWSLEMEEYTYEIKYRAGKSNGYADALSRRSDSQHTTSATEAPTRAQCETYPIT